MTEFWSALVESVGAVQVVGVIVAIIIALVLIMKIWPTLSALVKITDSIKDLPAFMETTTRQVQDIHHETHYNNGSSIKDSSKRTERALETVMDKIDALAASDDELRARVHDTLTPAEKAEVRALLAERRNT